MRATQRRLILLMSLAVCSWGILLHSSCKAAPKAWSVLGRGTLCRTRWPRMSQTCSIGDKSGDRAGQSRWSTLFCCRNCCTILARWGLALSSCSTTWYHKTSSSCSTMAQLWFILRDDLFYVLPCVILFLCFSVLLALRLSRLGKRELILLLFVRLFDLRLFGFVCFLLLLVSGKDCGLWLWHSLDFSSLNVFFHRLREQTFVRGM